MNAIAAWFRSKNITSHTVAALGISLAGLITFDPQVRNFVTSLFQAHPTLGADIVILAGLIAKYTHSSSAAGTVANAKIILDSPNAPTASAVDAASTK